MTIRSILFSSRINSLKLALGAMTVIALIAFPYIPDRTVRIYTGVDLWWGAYSDALEGGDSQFSYNNEWKTAVTCQFSSKVTYNMCGANGVFAHDTGATYEQLLSDLAYSMSVSSKITRDLSQFDGFWIDIDYQGPADFIHLILQNHEPALGMEDPNRQFRPHSVGIETSELYRPIYVRFKDFKVNDWWVKNFKLHRTEAGPRFDKIRAIAIELKEQPSQSIHHFEVKSLTLTGKWIKKESFYLFIILLLTGLIATEAITRVYKLYMRQRNAQRSIQELSEHNEKLRSAAYRDELTQLLNRRAIQELIFNEQYSQQNNNCYAVFVIDIDHFKKFNDIHGHALGDKVLAIVAKILQDSSRDYDNVARWGGEEFVIVTRATTRNNLEIYAQKLNSSVQNHQILSDKTNEPLSVTISIGVAQTEVGETFDNVFKRADEALYQSKADGRNRCTIDIQ